MGEVSLRGKLRLALRRPSAFQTTEGVTSIAMPWLGRWRRAFFGAEERRAARLRRTRRQTRMFEAQPSLRVCLAARAPEGSRSAA